MRVAMRYTNPNDIKTDHLSGASALTVGGLQAVIEYFKNTDTVLPEKLQGRLSCRMEGYS